MRVLRLSTPPSANVKDPSCLNSPHVWSRWHREVNIYISRRLTGRSKKPRTGWRRASLLTTQLMRWSPRRRHARRPRCSPVSPGAHHLLPVHLPLPSHAPPTSFPCTFHFLPMHLALPSHAPSTSFPCTSHAPPMHLQCTSREYFPRTRRAPRVYLPYISCLSPVQHPEVRPGGPPHASQVQARGARARLPPGPPGEPAHRGGHGDTARLYGRLGRVRLAGGLAGGPTETGLEVN